MVRTPFFASACAALSVLFTCATACSQTAPSTNPSNSGSNNAAPAAKPAAPALAVATGNAHATAPQPPAPKITFTDVNVDGPYIAMTFDDGPSGPNTPKLLDLAAKKHIKLTFFLVGECVAEHPELVKREVAEGHEVANHSWSHPNLAKMSDDAVHSQLQKTQDAIAQACGVTPKLLRPPYGEFTQRQRVWANKEWGFKILLWDVDPLDWKDRNAATVARRIISGARPGSIILSHDIHATTVAAMPEVFDTLLAKGYKFVTVSELLAMDKGGTRSAAKKPADDEGPKMGASEKKTESKPAAPASSEAQRSKPEGSPASAASSSPAAAANAATPAAPAPR